MFNFFKHYRYLISFFLYLILMTLSTLSFYKSDQLIKTQAPQSISGFATLSPDAQAFKARLLAENHQLFLFNTLILTVAFVCFFLVLARLLRRFDAISAQDSLTNLPNLASFEKQARHYIESDPDQQKKMAVLFLDIHGFKEMKDQYGQVISDNIITATGQKLARSLRSSDFISRIGGDEFVIGLPDLKSAQEVQTVSRRIVDNFDQSIRIDDQDYPVSICLGVSIYPEEGDNLKKLIKNADQAACPAKQSRPV
ncbi:MAG: GGDEF domain-containing protein [Eubacteriaceae bacterium]